MSAIVQNVCKLSHNVFSNFLSKNSRKLDENNVSTLKNLFSQITLNDIHFNLNELNLTNPEQSAAITFTSLFQNEFFSLTVFGFRHKASVIPLHDHPGMHGFIKCVNGCISIKSYTILNDLEPPLEILNKVSKYDYHSLVPSLYSGEEIVSSEHYKVGTLTPLERNIHEIRPLTNTAVMADIISPPYTEYTNSYFYKIVDTIFDSKINENVTWLLRTLHNNEYYCDSLIYHGPSISI